MTKQDLIDTIAVQCDMPKAKAEAALKTTLDAIATALKKGDAVKLIGFGTFSVTKKPARKGRNPATGAEIKIPAKTVAKFKAGKTLSDRVNSK